MHIVCTSLQAKAAKCSMHIHTHASGFAFIHGCRSCTCCHFVIYWQFPWYLMCCRSGVDYEFRYHRCYCRGYVFGTSTVIMIFLVCSCMCLWLYLVRSASFDMELSCSWSLPCAFLEYYSIVCAWLFGELSCFCRFGMHVFILQDPQGCLMMFVAE